MSGLLSFAGGVGAGWVDDADKAHTIDLRQLDHELDVELAKMKHGMNLETGEINQGYEAENMATQHGYGMAEIGARTGAASALVDKRQGYMNQRADKKRFDEYVDDQDKKDELSEWKKNNPGIQLGPDGKVITERKGTKPIILKRDMPDPNDKSEYPELISTPYAAFYPDTREVVKIPYGDASPGGKPVTMKDVEDFAKRKGITPAEVIDELRKKGVEVVK